MAIDNTDTIDGMAYDEESQAVVLLLTDHLSWKHTKETNILKESDHLVLLQDKINAYISFLEFFSIDDSTCTPFIFSSSIIKSLTSV